MEIIKIKIEDLKPYKNNAKLHPEWQIEQITKSIEQFGFNDPIAIWGENNIIVEGHGRLEAVKKIGYTEVECIRLDHLTDEERKAYTLAHNKTTMNSDFDFDFLKLELDDIKGIDMSDFGFELDLDDEEVEEDNFEVELPEEPKAKLGDVYQLGNHRLMCGDSTSVDDVEKLMDGVKADMVFTDPPYGMNLDTDWSGAKSKLQFYQEKGCKGSGNKYERVIGDNEDFKPELVTTIFNNFDYCKEIFVWGADYYPELLKDYKLGNMFVWDKRSNDDTNIDYVEQSDKMFGSQFELCWSKNKHRKQIARVKWAGIFGTEKEFDKKRVHPTQKPTSLSSWFIDKYSKENDLIVDIYGGSGSTLIACEQLNRNCYMMELDCKYIQVIIERYIAFTGNKVYRLNDDGTKTDWEDIK
jgi:DNA modification methylase